MNYQTSPTDLLGESLVLPDELSALAEEESSFPSGAVLVQDELCGALLLPSDNGSGSCSGSQTRGALLLPSDSGGSNSGLGSILGHGSQSGGHSGDAYEELIQHIRSPAAIGASATGGSNLASEASFSGSVIDLDGIISPHLPSPVIQPVRAVPGTHLPSAALGGPAAASPDSSFNTIGLSGSHANSNSFSQGSKGNQSQQDWSFSDTDLQELLERGSTCELGTPLASDLLCVPEAHELAAGSRVQSSRVASSLSSPHSHSQSVAPNSVPSSSPSGSIASRPRAPYATGLVPSPPQSLASGATSKSLVTEWSSGTRSSAAAARAHGARASEIGGPGARNAGSDDILESSFASHVDSLA